KCGIATVNQSSAIGVGVDQRRYRQRNHSFPDTGIARRLSKGIGSIPCYPEPAVVIAFPHRPVGTSATTGTEAKERTVHATIDEQYIVHDQRHLPRRSGMTVRAAGKANVTSKTRRADSTGASTPNVSTSIR